MTTLACGHSTTVDLPLGTPVSCHGKHATGRPQDTYVVGSLPRSG